MALRISNQAAKELGIDAFIPPKVTRATNKNEKGQNKTEAKFDRTLEDWKRDGFIKDYYFEEVKFRLAVKLHYTPDFFVVGVDDGIVVYEVKGFWRDDARGKIKMAAEKFPHIRWVAVRWINREWQYETIAHRG